MASVSRIGNEDTPALENDSSQLRAPLKEFPIAKNYGARGDLHLYRLASSMAFLCGGCHKTKTAKLVATYRNNWEDLRCNACYGNVLSKT